MLILMRTWHADMERYLGSQQNVHEALEMLDVIENTRFDLLTSLWRDTVDRSKDYHPGRTGVGADCVYYYPWETGKGLTLGHLESCSCDASAARRCFKWVVSSG